MRTCESGFTRVVNAGVALGCYARALAYSGVLGAVKDSPGPNVLSDDGEFLWVYAGLWFAAGTLAVFDLIRKRLGVGVSMWIILLSWWALSYMMAWVLSHFESWDWLSVAIYGSTVLVASGLLGALVNAREKNKQFITQVETSAVPVVKECDG